MMYICTYKCIMLMKKIILSALLLLSSTVHIWAQGCAMCTKVASGLGEDSAKGLNLGIIYLGSIPLIFMGIMFYKWYKSNKADNAESDE